MDSSIDIYNDSTDGDPYVRNELIGFNEDVKGYLIRRFPRMKIPKLHRIFAHFQSVTRGA
jgi:hypothetical protein